MDSTQDEKVKKTVVDYQSVELSPQDQAKLNEPLKDESGVDPKDTEFLAMLVKKIEEKEIDLHTPSTLINAPVYDGLDENAKGKADYEAYNMLATIREIYNLWNTGYKDSYQIQYMVHKIRLYKEKLEEVGGDIYVI